MGTEYRLDDVARLAGVASTTVRLYQTRGLLKPPRLEGRTGWYDDSHLSRLRLIARLQADGYSLAGIGNLLGQWEEGRSLGAVIGVEEALDALLGGVHAIELTPLAVLERFPTNVMTGQIMQRAASLGLVQPGENGNVRIMDRRFIEAGAELAHLGIPVATILDEWEALTVYSDEIAGRFIALFEEHLAPTGRDEIGDDEAGDLARTLARLQALARQVLAAALDASIARMAGERLGDLIET